MIGIVHRFVLVDHAVLLKNDYQIYIDQETLSEHIFLVKKINWQTEPIYLKMNLRRSCIHRYPIKVGFFFPFDIVDVLENLKNSNCSDYRNEFGSTNPQIATT